MATAPDEATRAQEAGDAQLMSAVARVPPPSTGTAEPQVPDCQVATEPSDRATRQFVDVGHDTEKVKVPTPGTAWAVIQEVPSNTSVSPVRSMAMQNREVGQDTEWSSDCRGDGCRVQVVPSKVAMLPVADTTTQNFLVAHEMFCTGRDAVPSSATASWPHVLPSNRLTTPAVLTEAQNVVDTHETSYWPPFGPVGAGPTATGADHAFPSQVTANWLESATQNVGEVHEIELRVPLGDAVAGVDQVDPFHMVAAPASSTAAQNVAVGQETP